MISANTQTFNQGGGFGRPVSSGSQAGASANSNSASFNQGGGKFL